MNNSEEITNKLVDAAEKEIIVFSNSLKKIADIDAPDWMMWIPLVLTIGTFVYMMIKL